MLQNCLFSVSGRARTRRLYVRVYMAAPKSRLGRKKSKWGQWRYQRSFRQLIMRRKACFRRLGADGLFYTAKVE